MPLGLEKWNSTNEGQYVFGLEYFPSESTQRNLQDRDLSAVERPWQDLIQVEIIWNITDIEPNKITMQVKFSDVSEVSVFRDDKDSFTL